VEISIKPKEIRLLGNIITYGLELVNVYPLPDPAVPVSVPIAAPAATPEAALLGEHSVVLRRVGTDVVGTHRFTVTVLVVLIWFASTTVTTVVNCPLSGVSD
jgi:hypothetical protein